MKCNETDVDNLNLLCFSKMKVEIAAIKMAF